MRVIEVTPGAYTDSGISKAEQIEWNVEPGNGTLSKMQRAVGGYICTAWRMPSPHTGRTIDVYCNDEGLMMEMPLCAIAPGGNWIVGPLVITASDDEGETVGLTDEEVNVVRGRFPVSECVGVEAVRYPS